MISVRELTSKDWLDVRRIYAQGIETGDATFESASPDWDQWDASHFAHSRLVAIDGNTVVGWAALSPVSKRSVYSGVAEVSVYVDREHWHKGIGRTLLLALIESAEQHGIWTLQAGIFPENIGSIKLHLECGFREVGRREKIGQMGGRWRDTLLFERRSRIVCV